MIVVNKFPNYAWVALFFACAGSWLVTYYMQTSFIWRKTAFISRLGGLNCGLAKTSLQEVSIALWAWKYQNWPMKVSKDQMM